MDVETKLYHMLQVLLFSEPPNKGELIQAYEKLQKIYIDPLYTESILETINTVKNNLFYKKFELENDPQFFIAIVRKIDNPLIADKLLESLTKIQYSDTEKKALEQQLPKLKLLFNFDNTLQERTRDFYELYKEDLDELKEILFSEVIHYKNLEWFLKSNFSKLIPGSSISFQISLNSVFQCLLENVRPELTEMDLNALRTIKRNINQKAPINHNMIFAHAPFIGKNLSPVAKDALKNSLKEYITPTSNFRH